MLDLIAARLTGVFGQERLARLHRAQIAVIGGGLLGAQLLLHAAMLQIRTLLVDPGVVEPENLGNQLFPADAVGEPKAQVRAAQMAALNPSCPVRALPERIEDVGLGQLADSDLLLTGLDSRASRLRVADIAQQLGVDWIDAAVDGSGERQLGVVTWFRPKEADLACYGCRYDGDALAEIAREQRTAPCASWRNRELPDSPPTLTASPFGGIVSGWQMSFAIRGLLGEGDALAGHQLQIAGGAPPRMRSVRLARNPTCRFSHASPPAASPSPDGDTVGDLVCAAERELGAPLDGVRFPGRSLVLGLVCPACGGRQERVKRCEAVSDAELRCPHCGSAECLPLELGDGLDAARLQTLASHTWRSLGIPDQDLVVASSAGREIRYLLRPAIEGGGAPS